MSKQKVQEAPSPEVSGLRVRVYRGERLARGARLALKNRLYVPGWLMRQELLFCADPAQAPARVYRCFKEYPGLDGAPRQLAICFQGSEPVAAALSEIAERPSVMAFCRQSQRRKGLASRCVRALRLPARAKARETSAWTPDFWASLGVAVRR